MRSSTQRANALRNTAAGCAMPCHVSAHHTRTHCSYPSQRFTDTHCSQLLPSTATGNIHRSTPWMDMLKCLYVLPRSSHPSYPVRHVRSTQSARHPRSQHYCITGIAERVIAALNSSMRSMIPSTYYIQKTRVRYISTYIPPYGSPSLWKRQTRLVDSTGYSHTNHLHSTRTQEHART